MGPYICYICWLGVINLHCRIFTNMATDALQPCPKMTIKINDNDSHIRIVGFITYHRSGLVIEKPAAHVDIVRSHKALLPSEYAHVNNIKNNGFPTTPPLRNPVGILGAVWCVCCENYYKFDTSHSWVWMVVGEGLVNLGARASAMLVCTMACGEFRLTNFPAPKAHMSLHGSIANKSHESHFRFTDPFYRKVVGFST